MGGYAAEFPVEFSRYGEHGVPEFLGGQAPRLKHGVTDAIGVQLTQFLGIGMPGSASIGGGAEKQTIHFLEGPIVLHESGSQPVEQLGMSRFFAGAPEIVGITGQGLSEAPLPDAVHYDAGGQRVVLGGDPLAPECRGRSFKGA